MNRPKPTCGSLLVGLLLSVSLTSCSTMLNRLWTLSRVMSAVEIPSIRMRPLLISKNRISRKNNLDRPWDTTRKKAAEQTGKKSY